MIKKISNFVRLGDVVKIKYFTVSKKKRKIFEVIGLCFYKTKKLLKLKFSCTTEPIVISFDMNTPYLLNFHRLYKGTPSGVKRNYHTYKNSFFNFTDFAFLNNLMRHYFVISNDNSLLVYYKFLSVQTTSNLIQLVNIDSKAKFRVKKKYRI